MVVMVAKLIRSGHTVWRSASPSGGWDANATNTVSPIITMPSTTISRSTARPARLDRNSPMAITALSSPPHLMSSPIMALSPRAAPAMLPTLNTSPPKITSTAST